MTPPILKLPPPYPQTTLLETDHWLAIDKPPHLLVHPTRPNGEPTILTTLQQEHPSQFFAPVNRIDRETSGIVLFAKSPEAASILGKQTENRKIKKRYIAIASGTPLSEGTIKAPLDRLCKHQEYPIYVKQAVISEENGGYPATTHYATLESRDIQNETCSLLSLTLETGRLHQIRVHLSHIGHHVIGDKLYGPSDQCYLDFIENGWTKHLEKQLKLSRQALHASEMEFSWQGNLVQISSPLPQDLHLFWNS